MLKIFQDFFDSEKIFYRSEIRANDVEVIQPHLMPENIKSVIVWLMPYYTGPHTDRNISLYAVSRDYHIYAKELGEKLCGIARKQFPEENFYSFCDSSPIYEVGAALTGGLGVLGKNRLLINEKYGSYVFIGIMLSTLEPVNPKNEQVKSCICCGKCYDACSFLSKKAGICMSDLNQKKQLTDDELFQVRSEKIRWGCDKCQEICPMNTNVSETPINFFHEEIIENITPEMLESMSKDEFKSRAFSWRGKKTIIRNLDEY